MNQQQYANGPLYSTQTPYSHAHAQRFSYQQNQQHQHQHQHQQQPQHHHQPQHQLPAASSTPPANLVTSAAASGAHTLPPIGANDYSSSMGHDALLARAQPMQPSLFKAEPNSLGQQTPTPIYAPTSTTFFSGSGPVTTYPQTGLTGPTYKPSQSSFQGLQNTSNATFPGVSRSSRLPDLRPMPINTMADLQGDLHSAPPSSGTPPGSASRLTDDGTVHSIHVNDAGGAQPIHVVGSQGRRGILPSVAGRPVALDPSVSGPKSTANPVKDASGKFPCEHCAKTYLHAKHLKRHMLRHTGVRPYTCGLCRDTFSRSDILKRHFQKCSARRGNPSGESHLTHSRANKKARAEEEQQQAAAAATTAVATKAESTPTDSAQSSATFPATAFDTTLDLRSLDLSQANFGDMSRPSVTSMSRSNSIKKAKTSRNSSHRGSLGTAPTSSFDPNMPFSTGHVTPDSITTSGAATPYTYPHENRSNQISPDGPLNRNSSAVTLGAPPSRPQVSSHYSTGSLPQIVGQQAGRGAELDWPTYSNFPSQDDFGSGQFNTGTVTPHQVKGHLDFSSLSQNLFHFNNK